MTTFRYGIDRMTPGIAVDICRGTIKGELTQEAAAKISANRAAVDEIVAGGTTVYGINTGFGPLCTTVISDEDTRKLQMNLLLSHAVGVGDLIDEEISRMMLILKVHSLAMGFSGISLTTLQRILWHIENNITPCVPSQGSVGASGDLAPLAHLFLPLIGFGTVFSDGRIVKAGEILRRHNLNALEMGPKEGLALINGTQFIAAHAVVFVARMQNCLDNADIIAAMNLEAMLGSVKAFDPALHELRPYRGVIYVAERMRTIIGQSEIVESHRNCHRVQDPYSLRCIPQVHGATRNAYIHLKQLLTIELNSVTDNPIVFSKDKSISGGNFHGQPMALPIDYAAFSAAELGNISDRRIYLSLMDTIEGLPKLLMKETGLNSGFMIPQYTTAALVSENKSLCFPASADSIPTSLGQEDHVSMGSVSSRKALQIIGNLEKILGIELFCAAQGMDFRKPLKSGPLMEACHAHVRSKIPHIDRDVYLGDYINSAVAMVKNQELTKLTTELALDLNIDFKNSLHELFGIY
ncbi:MAG TPA: histidine ammonia-lyase [Bacteroidales bacterium]|nr:histidine ammonia-lyase [Bacteroidales bacterium]